MIIDEDEFILYDGTNSEEIIEWARERGENNLQMFGGSPTFFFPTQAVTLMPGEYVTYNKDMRMVSVRIKKIWYNENVKNS